jgi:anti-sigma factor RsiW
MQCAEALRVQAYFDGEIDAIGAAEIERHADTCAECRSLLAQLEDTRGAIRRLPTEGASPELRRRIALALDKEEALDAADNRGESEPASSRTRIAGEPARGIWRLPGFWAGAVGGLGAACAAGLIAFLVWIPVQSNRVTDQLVTAHIRSLMPEHLIDVVSTDQHTVKPWFSGHADVSPAVADFASEGYKLVGGRADYVENQRSAVVVYQHGRHTINVFSWVADEQHLPATASRNGYRLAFWKDGNVAYCAVSDTGWEELLGLVHLLQKLPARE